MVLFAELSLRTVVEFYASTAHFQEIVESVVFVDIVKVRFLLNFQGYLDIQVYSTRKNGYQHFCCKRM